MRHERPVDGVARSGDDLSGLRLKPLERPVTVDEFIRVFEALQRLDHLGPSPECDAFCGELASMSISTGSGGADSFFDQPAVAERLVQVREMFALAEYLREAAWARRIASESSREEAWSRLPFRRNYERLVAFEAYAAMACAERPVNRCLMVGSGPVPISAMMLALLLGGVRVDALDIESDAVELGRKVCLAMGSDVNFVCGSAAEFEDYDEYDLVLLGASVELAHAERVAVVEHVASKMPTGAALVVRTAHDMRRLLVPQLDPNDIEAIDWQFLVRPLGRVVNSVIVGVRP